MGLRSASSARNALCPFIFYQDFLGPPTGGKTTSLKRSPSSLSAVSGSSIESFRHKKSNTTLTDYPPTSPSNKDKGVRESKLANTKFPKGLFNEMYSSHECDLRTRSLGLNF